MKRILVIRGKVSKIVNLIHLQWLPTQLNGNSVEDGIIVVDGATVVVSDSIVVTVFAVVVSFVVVVASAVVFVAVVVVGSSVLLDLKKNFLHQFQFTSSAVHRHVRYSS